MVESGGETLNRTSPAGASVGSRCGVLETRVRGAWYRVMVTLETDYLSVSLDESCDTTDQSTTLNGTLGYVFFLYYYCILSSEPYPLTILIKCISKEVITVVTMDPVDRYHRRQQAHRLSVKISSGTSTIIMPWTMGSRKFVMCPITLPIRSVAYE